MKRLITIAILTAALMISCLSVSAESVYRYGNWTLSATTGTDGYVFGVRSYDGKDAVVTLPGDYGGYPVAAVNAYAFVADKTVRKLTLHENNTIIGEGAFFAAEKLERVTLTPSVEKIGKNAFAQCKKLTKIEIPGVNTVIGDNAFKNSPNAVIYAPSNSAAIVYAKEHNIKYVCTDECILGDANGDSDVSISDVTAIQRHNAELEIIDGTLLKASDVNADGEVNVTDATTIQMYLAEYQVEYPVGENAE